MLLSETDPGVPIYAGFGALTLTTCISCFKLLYLIEVCCICFETCNFIPEFLSRFIIVLYLVILIWLLLQFTF